MVPLFRNPPKFRKVNYRSKLDPSLVLWLRFDEGSGTTAYDSSRYFNNGTITGATYSAGKVGSYCLSFDGGDYVSLGAPASLDMRTAATISFWVIFDTLDTVADYPSIFNSKSGGGTGKGINLYFINTSNKMTFTIFNNDIKVAEVTTTKTDWSTATWYHITVVWDSTLATKNIQWYINKVAENSGDDTDVPNGISAGIRVGSTWEGDIDELRVYNRALSATEVSELYTAMGGT